VERRAVAFAERGLFIGLALLALVEDM